MITRRTVLTGLLAAPIVVRSGLVIPISAAAAEKDRLFMQLYRHTGDIGQCAKVLVIGTPHPDAWLFADGIAGLNWRWEITRDGGKTWAPA